MSEEVEKLYESGVNDLLRSSYVDSSVQTDDYKLFRDLGSGGGDCRFCKSIVLSGNGFDASKTLDWETAFPNYDIKVHTPYDTNKDPLMAWRQYFVDILTTIQEDVERRNGSAVPLDFASVCVIIATLSSLIELKGSDIVGLAENVEYQKIGGATQNQVQKNKDHFLEGDGLMFKWFVCTYLLPSEAKKEDVAMALYQAVRCGLVHGLVVGSTFRKPRNYEIAIASKDPFSKNRWFDVDQANSQKCSFYLAEMLAVIRALIDKLFDSSATDQDIKRFQGDALPRLKSIQPLRMLIATEKVRE